MKNITDGLFIKKLETAKWPYEVYRGNILQDFWLILTSQTKKRVV